jgi:uncharacterized membrane protein YsdA (DUF1294 family)
MAAVAAALLLIFAGLLVMNVLAYTLFALDKARAEAGEWRISERTLLWAALLGGSLGAKLAQRRFRHKTRKEPFRTALNAICVVQALAIASLLLPLPRALAAEAVVGLGETLTTLIAPDADKPRRFGPGS